MTVATPSPKPGEQVVLANEEFLAMLAHELRNPLAPIMNALHVVERNSAVSNQLVRNATDILSRQVNHIVGTINDLMDIARIVKNDMQLLISRVEVSKLIHDTVNECQPIFASRKNIVDVTLSKKAVWVEGDRQRLQQILYHLFANAAKFTETGGKISITMNYSSERVMINVKDNGVGMPPEAISRVFYLFNQPDHTRHLAQGGGLGVGLTLSRELAVLHGGTIEAFSEGIGRGSEFTVILPLLEVTEAETPESKKPVMESANKCLEIMVVDDHIDTAESLAVLLKMWGHMVHVCHSGTAAVQMAKINSPDVALLDIGLPGCDGYEVAEKLKQEVPGILLIAITGYGQKVDRRRSAHSGFRHHLVKPVVPEKLKQALASRE